MEQLLTFRDVIDRWPSRIDFARDLGVKLDRVHKWAQPGGNIRAEFFLRITQMAEQRGLVVTADDLCRIAEAEAAARSVCKGAA